MSELSGKLPVLTDTPGQTLARVRRSTATFAQRTAGRGLPLIAAVFLISLVIPLILQVGPIRLSAYRLVLLATVLPCLLLWLTGRAGRMLVADFCFLGISLWSALSLFVVHGPTFAIEPSGILFIETIGAWLLARCFIRTPEAFFSMARLLFFIVILMLPGAIWEALTGQNIILDLFGKIGPVFPDVYKAPRLGLDRVQGPFEHPILFGVFCGSIIGLTYYVLGYHTSFKRRMRQTSGVFFTAAGTLSSGPLTALTSQAFLITWDHIFVQVKRRWWMLAGLAALAYLAVDFLSNRTPVEVFVSYFAFNPRTAYNRILIWEWGTRSILDHPLFGVGLGDWERPHWMSPSADMFWIVPAMRHGVPVWILYFIGFFSITGAVAHRRNLTARLHSYRNGYLVSMAGLFAVGWTVHFWNATFVLFVFLLGSGACLLDADARHASIDQPDEKGDRIISGQQKAPRPRTWL